MSTATLEAEALAAADAIIEGFGNHRRGAYFAGFSPDATFVFHSHPKRLESRAEYEELWRSWERDSAFRVHSCRSTNRRVQVVGEVAIFTHDVETVLEIDGVVETAAERETIVLQRSGDGWLCVHEHLSTAS